MRQNLADHREEICVYVESSAGQKQKAKQKTNHVHAPNHYCHAANPCLPFPRTVLYKHTLLSVSFAIAPLINNLDGFIARVVIY